MDRAKIEEILAQTDFVRSLARSLVLDENSADDISQQALLAAIEARPTTERPLRAWFSGVVRNLAKLGFRKDRSRLRREQHSAQADRVPSAADEAELKEVRRTIVDAVLELEEPCRSAIEQRYFAERGAREVAEKLNIPIETVRTRLKRGLAKLRSKLDKEFGDRGAWCLALAPLAGIKVGMKAATAGVAASTVCTVSGGILMATKVKVGIAAVMVLGVVIVVTLWQTKSNEVFEKELNSETVLAPSYLPDPTQSEIEKPIEIATVNLERVAIDPATRSVTTIGRVSSKRDRSPVSGAQIVLTPLPFREENDKYECTSEGNGCFSKNIQIPIATTLYGLDIEIKAEGYKSFVTNLSLNERSVALDCGTLYLSENPKYDFRIVDNFGRPVSDACVRFYTYWADNPFSKQLSDKEGYVHTSEQELRPIKGQSDNTLLYVSAPGMADHFYYEPDENLIAPDKIIMEPARKYVGRIVDGETELGISKMPVKVEARFLPSSLGRVLDELMKEWAIVTDIKGEYEISNITFSENISRSIWVMSAEYVGNTPWASEFPSLIKLKRKERDSRKRVQLECIAIDYATGKVLPHLKIDRGSTDIVSDELGKFYLDLLITSHICPRLMAPDERMFFNGRIKLGELEDGVCRVHFRKIILSEFRVKVEDEIGRPLTRARVDLNRTHDDGFGTSGNIHVEVDGTLKTPVMVTNPPTTQTSVKVYARGFCPFRSELGFLEEWVLEQNSESNVNDSVLRIVLRRRTVNQSIRVVDGNGKPLKGIAVLAKLTCGGDITSLREKTGIHGQVEMGFPQFQEGRLFVEDRPDTTINIHHNDIVEQKEITIICLEENASTYLVQGVIKEAQGKLLRDIHIWPSVMTGKRQYFDVVKSDDDGSFRFPAFNGRVYAIEIDSIFNEGVYYYGTEQSGLISGTNIIVILDSMSGIKVEIDYSDPGKYVGDKNRLLDSWLENENGQMVEGSKEIIRPYSAILLGIQDGQYQVVVQTIGGDQYRSELIGIKNGKHEEIIKIKG